MSRLFTDRTLRGTGTALLAEAVRQARARHREPVLEVDPDSPARALYGRRGWREVGQVRQQWGHRTVDSVAMVLDREQPGRPDDSGSECGRTA